MLFGTTEKQTFLVLGGFFGTRRMTVGEVLFKVTNIAIRTYERVSFLFDLKSFNLIPEDKWLPEVPDSVPDPGFFNKDPDPTSGKSPKAGSE